MQTKINNWLICITDWNYLVIKKKNYFQLSTKKCLPDKIPVESWKLTLVRMKLYGKRERKFLIIATKTKQILETHSKMNRLSYILISTILFWQVYILLNSVNQANPNKLIWFSQWEEINSFALQFTQIAALTPESIDARS